MADEEEEKKPAEGNAEGGAEAGEGGDEAAPAKKGLDKKMLIVIGASVLSLLIGLGGGAVMMKMSHGSKEGEPAAAEASHTESKSESHGEGKEGETSKASYYSLGDMLVNLNGDSRHPNFLKIKVSLELADPKDVTLMDSIKPRIIDNFQVYLRGLRIDDLKGSAGLYRLREELLLRVTEAAQPVRVKDVLFQEMLVQ